MAASDSDRLNGWNEIATFLGKGVRTVQRWEREYGLPIHRLGREGAEIVFAFRGEIERWTRESDLSANRETTVLKDSASVLGHEGASADDVTPQSDAVSGPARRTELLFASGIRLVLFAAMGLIVSVLAAWVYWPAMREPDPDRDPAHWRIEGNQLRVSNQKDESLWAHTFEFALAPRGAYVPEDNFPGFPLLIIRDVDGDGSREVLILTAPADPRTRSGELYCFNRDGSVRFVVRPPRDAVTFGDTEYSAPWLSYRLFVLQDPETGQVSIFPIFVHGLLFPSVLLEVNGRGELRSEYWSNGFIEIVAEARWKGLPVLLVGAAYNESKGASLAIFKRGRINGAAPASSRKYGCRGCPTAQPLAFLVFPQRCLGREYLGCATISEAWIDARDRIQVRVADGVPRITERRESGIWYALAPDLMSTSAEVTTQLVRLHDRLYHEGVIDHSFCVQDERDLWPVLSWDGARFVPLLPGLVSR